MILKDLAQYANYYYRCLLRITAPYPPSNMGEKPKAVDFSQLRANTLTWYSIAKA